MPNHWKFLRSMISAADLRSELFLSLIDEEGAIICANATMQRSLDLDNPRLHHINFFHLLHPEHSSDFREAVRRSRATQKPAAAELYLKNGYYHPMKWQVNHVEDQGSGLSGFLCIGYKLVDDQRIEQFNQVGASNYQLIVEGLNAGVLFQDDRGELIAANKKAATATDPTTMLFIPVSSPRRALCRRHDDCVRDHGRESLTQIKRTRRSQVTRL